MPVLEARDSITPRSALRYRPISGENAKTGKRTGGTVTTTAAMPVARRASRPKARSADIQPQAQDDIAEWQRIEVDDEDEPATERPVTPTQRAVRTRAPKAIPKAKPLPRGFFSGITLWANTLQRRMTKRPAHPLLYLGIGMLGMLTLWSVLTVAVTWFHTTMDDIHYGRPRTFQTDQFVGHGETNGVPSHFIAINFHGRIEVIEMPGGDATHARIFMGPQLYVDNSDLVPVTLAFRDVNGDHKPDMIVQFQGSQVIFINDAGSFRPLRPEERHQVEQFLQQTRQ
jgi:hypothetical protein